MLAIILNILDAINDGSVRDLSDFDRGEN